MFFCSDVIWNQKNILGLSQGKTKVLDQNKHKETMGRHGDLVEFPFHKPRWILYPEDATSTNSQANPCKLLSPASRISKCKISHARNERMFPYQLKQKKPPELKFG